MGQINQDLKVIAGMLEIDTPLSTYVARHTYATVLKKGGGDISKISQALGHTDLNTTKIYLKDFEDNEIDSQCPRTSSVHDTRRCIYQLVSKSP